MPGRWQYCTGTSNIRHAKHVSSFFVSFLCSLLIRPTILNFQFLGKQSARQAFGSPFIRRALFRCLIPAKERANTQNSGKITHTTAGERAEERKRRAVDEAVLQRVHFILYIFSHHSSGRKERRRKTFEPRPVASAREFRDTCEQILKNKQRT